VPRARAAAATAHAGGSLPGTTDTQTGGAAAGAAGAQTGGAATGVKRTEEVNEIASKVAAILLPKFEAQMAELANKISPRLTPEQADKVEKSMFLIFTKEGKSGAPLTEDNLRAHQSASTSNTAQGSGLGSQSYSASQFAGAGFFYAQPGLGITPRHQLTEGQIAGTSTVRVYVPRYGTELELKVVAEYEEKDFAYLRCTTHPESGAGTDIITAEKDTPTPGASVVMFSSSLGQWLQLSGASQQFDPKIVQRIAKIMTLVKPRFSYSTSTFKGDCGSPIVLSSGGKLVGMHVEMVNEVDDPALKKRKTTPSRRLSDLESSVASSGPHEAVALLATFFPPVPPMPRS